MPTSLQIASVVAALGLGVTLGEYRSTPTSPTPAPTQESGQEGQMPEGMSPEMMEEMAAWMRAGTPGEHHELLDPMVGGWDAEVTLYLGPDMTEKSTGTMVNEWVFDGRYVVGTFEGSAMGQPFSGMSILAYDNAAQTYRGLWIDSMSTGFQQSAGYASEDGKTWTFKTTTTDPVSGEPIAGKEEVVVESEDRHRMTAWYEEDGELVKSMEIVYTRQ